MTHGNPADETETETEAQESVETSEGEESVETSETGSASEAVLDVESAEQRERGVEDLREEFEEQNERIEELEDLLLDLSTRVADGDGTGVCPDCHGPVAKRNPWFRSARIECVECGRVFHEY
jgi:predicted RNase H-like nuclease (RuvC/YqgF family)